MDLIYLVVGLLVGAMAAYFVLKVISGGEEKSLRERLGERDAQTKRDQDAIDVLRSELSASETNYARLESATEERQIAFEAQRQTLLDAEKRFTDAFAGLSREALKKTNEQFLQLAQENFLKHQEGATGDLKRRHQAIEELVKPLKESLDKLDKQTQDIEQKRVAAYEGVSDQINRLVLETSQLSGALRKPHVRGSWGELTLRRAAEAAGLVEGQDFRMQVSTDTEDGRLRPDMVVNLPGNGVIVVDSKVPLEAYLEAIAATDEGLKMTRLKAHARQVRSHIQQLSSKAYWNQFERSPDYVVMFVPSESLYQSAFEQDVELFETAFNARVILANPMTLIALLRTVAYGMKQEQVRENAHEIMNAGAKLYDAVRTFAGHMQRVGRHLGQTTEAYNNAIGSMDRNVISKARQLREMGAASGDELALPEEVDLMPRLSQMAALPETRGEEN